MKHMIFNNDVCEMYSSIETEPAEFSEADEEELLELSDDKKWDQAYEEIENWLDTEMSNLDIDVNGQILLIGKEQRWNGARSVYKVLDTKNIGQSMQDAMNCFGGDNTFEVYAEDGSMFLSQTGHDNPTTPSIIEFREMTVDFDELEDDLPATLYSHSRPLAPYACDVYGWEVAA